MGEVARIDDFVKDVAVFLSPSARQKEIAAYAAGALAAAQVVNRRALGRFPAYDTTVDGRKGAALTSVNPNNGYIQFDFKFLDPAVLRWISDQLNQHSPQLSGRYKSSHVLLADGNPVQIADKTPSAKRYVFLNVQPYAQKIEKGFSSKAPTGVYQAVAVLAAREFPDIKISFGYEKADPSWLSVSRQSTETSLAWVAHQPAIIILDN